MQRPLTCGFVIGKFSNNTGSRSGGVIPSFNAITCGGEFSQPKAEFFDHTSVISDQKLNRQPYLNIKHESYKPRVYKQAMP